MAVNAILFGTLTGTSLMTLISYYLSRKANRNFREPDLLNQLIFNFKPFGFIKKPVFPGWILHYAVGLIFVIGFHFFWKVTSITPSLLSGSLLGLICGFIGVAGWHLVFLLHPNPPSIELKEYYIHLIVVHIFFGLGAAAGYELVN